MKVWFITGTSRGLGRAWAHAALSRGDSVAATALDTGDLSALTEEFGDQVLPIELNVNDRDAAIDAVQTAAKHFGRLDVVVNNAGFGHLGMIEEFTEDEIRNQMETNFFGALWVTQACIPILRDQGGGRIIQVSSMGGLTAYPVFGGYNASKWALEGMSQALAGEVAPFGIKVTLVEPAGYATDWWGSSLRRTEPLPAYEQLHSEINARWESSSAGRGDPAASAPALLTIVDSDDPPLRVLFGVGALGRVVEEYESRLSVWREWEELTVTAQGS